MNTYKFSRSLSALALASALLLAGCGGKSKTGTTEDVTTAEFKMNLPKGQKYNTTMVMDQQIETSAMGSTMNINQTMTFEFDVEVKDHKDNGNHVVANTYKRVALTQSMPGMGAMGETVVDTKDPSKNKGMVATMMAESFGKLIDKTFEMEMDQYGKVLSTNMSQLMQEMGSGDDGDMGGGDMSAYNVQYPNKPIKVGESWEGETVQKNKGMNMKIKTTYTLKAIKDGVAEVDMKSVISSDTTSAGELFGKISGSQTGTSFIELKTGWSKEMKLNQDMTMEMGEGVQNIPMKMKSTITLTSK